MSGKIFKIYSFVVVVIFLTLIGCSYESNNAKYEPKQIQVQNKTEANKGIALIDSSKITINNFYPNAEVNQDIKIQNNNKNDIVISVSYDNDSPQFIKEWIEKGLGEYTIKQDSMLLVPIVVKVPKDYKVTNKNLVFNLIITDVTQKGSIQVAYKSKWIINMR